MNENYGSYHGPNRAVPIGPTSPPEQEPSLDELLDGISDEEVAAWWQNAFDAMHGSLDAANRISWEGRILFPKARWALIDDIADMIAAPLQRLYQDNYSETLRYKAEALCVEMDIIARKAILRQKGYEVE